MEEGELENKKVHSERKTADIAVLGRLMAAQNLLFVLPDKKNIASFYAPLIQSIPGVRSCRICLGNYFSNDGGFNDDRCASCPNRNGVLHEFSTLSKDIECQYAHHPSIYSVPLETTEYRF